MYKCLQTAHPLLYNQENIVYSIWRRILYSSLAILTLDMSHEKNMWRKPGTSHCYLLLKLSIRTFQSVVSNHELFFSDSYMTISIFNTFLVPLGKISRYSEC